ncbi:hypothetical protein [Bradyrhizobium sp. ERR14]|uniref:hypothetical protein n=1 Tax=Bradyrhizobium sp. ERR14 TaxID=2663837 RepID=UPI00161DE175|nr:hypothetical protein [Bradyrhizobium sp. ERR14]MBB4395813.1 hypothetical protein [Bradyrhizobium sp. ERR14]
MVVPAVLAGGGDGVADAFVAGAVVAAGAVAEVGAVVAVWTFAGCDGAWVVCGETAAAVAGCSVACWLELLAAKLRLRDPPA